MGSDADLFVLPIARTRGTAEIEEVEFVVAVVVAAGGGADEMTGAVAMRVWPDTWSDAWALEGKTDEFWEM